jgi:hypothetical protein
MLSRMPRALSTGAPRAVLDHLGPGADLILPLATSTLRTAPDR